MTDHASPPPSPPQTPVGQRTLRRSADSRVVAGVAGGLAEYLDLDPTPLRVGFVAASLLLGGLGGPLLYLLAWAVLPEDGKESVVSSSFAAGAKHWQSWGRNAGGIDGAAS